MRWLIAIAFISVVSEERRESFAFPYIGHFVFSLIFTIP